MKIKNIIILGFAIVLIGCKENKLKTENNKEHSHEIEEMGYESNEHEGSKEHEEHEEKVTLSKEQVDVLGIKIDSVRFRNMGLFIQANGELAVPPQNEAVVTSVFGANIVSIKTIEGDKVKKGQVLGYISHPDIINLETSYLESYNNLAFLEQEYKRQETLYKAKVVSGKDFQKSKANYSSAKGLAKGYESQLKLLGLNFNSIKNGTIIQNAPIISPINGFIEKVNIKMGQFVEPQTALFEIVNNEHIHVDLMIFEKDVSKVKENQLVRFKIQSSENKEYTAKIFSVGKTFEQNPKALHIHAEIENEHNNLLPGMYVNATILISESNERALPEGAVFLDGEDSYIFSAEENGENWSFTPVKVLVNHTSMGYTSFKFKEKVSENLIVATNQAYYLISEMKKSEAEHSH
ncbi:efflux RND transporter periplasmic adaptor subunit [Lutibacter citreus]|uniref:efflux RND transporter periplasmic adaptor subunit n=1 Tax=Lutibacter citreus TaxID=2138210 RepID=UPI000DBE55DB|nr:efflux RND transporter periplasmic adaptor subunit [Lutibacter citreus]